MTVDIAFVQQYKDMIRIKVQQEASKLRETVELDTNFVGEYKFYDQIGSTDMVEKTTRNQDTPSVDPDHARRRISKRDWLHNVLFDKEDQLNMIVDPKSSYARTAAMAAGRTLDDRIIAALGGTAYAGKTGSTETTLPDTQKVVVGGAGLTKAKLLSAKQKLDEAEVQEDERFFICESQQITDLLNLTEVASADFNTVRALVEGKIDSWLGFKFIRTQRLSVDGSSSRLCYAYHRWGIQLAIQKEPTVKIDQRSDKNYAWQVFLSMSLGATRLEEERVVEVACAE